MLYNPNVANNVKELMDPDFSEIQKRCGRNLRQVREEKRMSVEALAALSGVDEDEIKGIAAGTNDFYISTLFLLVDELNVDFRRIMVSHSCFVQ